MLTFHPDFIRKYPLGTKIRKLKFFSYETNEALHIFDAERFYTRQFRTRHNVESDIVTRFESILHRHFEKEPDKLITANDVASELSMSTHYLSDLLRNLTGMNTQQHIHAHLIERAKALLLTTNLSVNEIAYSLGFEYPQYFSRLFKNKTGQTPVGFRLMN